jgi:pimeloyl-ACP methyl ester carboxylesterase
VARIRRSSGCTAAARPRDCSPARPSLLSSTPGSRSSPTTSAAWARRRAGAAPADQGGHFNLLIADASGAVEALRKRTDIDPKQLGFFGVSQAGWIVPRAAVRAHVAFTVLVSGPAVTLGEEHEYSHLTGEEGGHPSGLSRADILRKLHPSGFDQKPDLQRMTMPGLWLYGADDLSQPTDLSVGVLHHLKQADGKDFTTVVFRNAGHGLLDGTGDPRVINAMVKFVRRHVHMPR